MPQAMLSVSSLTLWLNAIELNVSHYVDFRIEMNQRQSVDPRKKFEKGANVITLMGAHFETCRKQPP